MTTDHEELRDRLERLAYKKTIPFCYSCYEPAPSGRCGQCQSDDLMRLLPGSGVEYGVDWVIRDLLRANLTPVNVEEAFEQSVRECYPETTKVGWAEFDTVTILKELDPVAWSLAASEWCDSEEEDDAILSFDNGSMYYWTHEIEVFLDEANSESEAEAKVTAP